MSRGVNKVILIGNLGKDPEVKFTPGSNKCLCTLSLATSNSWKDKGTGETKEKTEWHRVVLFNRLGEVAGQYLKTGSKVFIEGYLRTREWKDKNEVKHWTTEVVGQEMQMLDSKGPTDETAQEMPKYEQHSQIQDDDIPF